MTVPTSLWRSPAVQEACAALTRATDRVVQETLTIQQIAAPTFAEHERAHHVEKRFRELGLTDVQVDENVNVYSRVPGRESGPALLVSAHLDTVFGPETDLSTHYTGDCLYGPGIGDNSLGVAALFAVAKQVREFTPRRDVWFVANAAEEGLGNLRGMRAVIDRLAEKLGAVIVLEGGAYGTVIHAGIGVQRRRLMVETAGGHAWSDFGSPSAIHELCQVGAAISNLKVPTTPRTTYNLGTIEGGTSVNTIASSATALLDLRSEDPSALDQVAARVDALLDAARRDGVIISSEEIGERPAASIPTSHPLVCLAIDALGWVGHSEPSLRAASTDANIPLAKGIPAICIGLTVGHHAHRLDEYIELAPLPSGLKQSFLVIWTTVEKLL